MRFRHCGGESWEPDALRKFTATTSERHERRWGWEAQDLVRALAAGVPLDHDTYLGWDDDHRLAAVSARVCGENETYLQVIAVTTGHQGRGLGEQLLVATLRAICGRAGNDVVTTVHEDNAASRALVLSCGFTLEARWGDDYLVHAR